MSNLLIAESPQVREMWVLELLAVQVAEHEGSGRRLAVLAEAWQQAGMNLIFLTDAVATALVMNRDDAYDLVRDAYYRRPRKVLRADARNLRDLIKLLDRAGVLTDEALAAVRWPRPYPEPTEGEPNATHG
jgi:hypothetical protein